MKIEMIPWSVQLLLSLSFAFGIQDGGNSTLESAIREQEEVEELVAHKLSRTRSKRFITFPDGSSLQLAFYCQTADIVFIGDIFYYANTAAFAWELPSDPSFLYMFKDKQGNLLRRKDDVRNVYYLDEKGKFLFKVPYKRRFIVSPVFGKRSIPDSFQIRKFPHEATSNIKPKPPTEARRKEMHALQQKREYLKNEHISESAVEFHRHSRKGLYEKLEVFFKALGMDGRQCLLRTLCEIGSRSTDDDQGSFLEEMMRSVFTLPQGVQFDKDKHREYDTAHRAGHSCDTLYPSCRTIPDKLYI